MQLRCLEACFNDVLVDEAHSLDPVGKDQDLGGNPLPSRGILYNHARHHEMNQELHKP